MLETLTEQGILYQLALMEQHNCICCPRCRRIKADLEQRAKQMKDMHSNVQGLTCEGIAEIYEYIIKTHFGDQK